MDTREVELGLRKALDYIFMLSVVGLYIMNGFCLKDAFSGLLRVFFLNHFNDLICPFFILAFSDILLIKARRPIGSLTHIYAIMLPAAFIWECFAPLINAESVADPIDFICYLIGAFAFWFTMQTVFRLLQASPFQKPDKTAQASFLETRLSVPWRRIS